MASRGSSSLCVVPKVASRSQWDRNVDFSSKKKEFPKRQSYPTDNGHLEVVPASGSQRLQEKLRSLHSPHKRQTWNEPTCPSTGMEKAGTTVLQGRRDQQGRGAQCVCLHVNGSQNTVLVGRAGPKRPRHDPLKVRLQDKQTGFFF